MMAKIAIFCSLTASDTLNLFCIFCATISLNLFTHPHLGQDGFSVVHLLQDRSKNKKLSRFHTEL